MLSNLRAKGTRLFNCSRSPSRGLSCSNFKLVGYGGGDCACERGREAEIFWKFTAT